MYLKGIFQVEVHIVREPRHGMLSLKHQLYEISTTCRGIRKTDDFPELDRPTYVGFGAVPSIQEHFFFFLC